MEVPVAPPAIWRLSAFPQPPFIEVDYSSILLTCKVGLGGEERKVRVGGDSSVRMIADRLGVGLAQRVALCYEGAIFSGDQKPFEKYDLSEEATAQIIIMPIEDEELERMRDDKPDLIPRAEDF